MRLPPVTVEIPAMAAAVTVAILGVDVTEAGQVAMVVGQVVTGAILDVMVATLVATDLATMDQAVTMPGGADTLPTVTLTIAMPIRAQPTPHQKT